jgi:hypothetical protein
VSIALHVGGVPVEELLPTAAGAGAGAVGAGLLLARAWVSVRLRRIRRRVDRPGRPD